MMTKYWAYDTLKKDEGDTLVCATQWVEKAARTERPGIAAHYDMVALSCFNDAWRTRRHLEAQSA